MTRMTSSPRLMRPERSVMHSPRLTNRNGVLTRTGPPRTERHTPGPISPHLPSSGPPSKNGEAPVKRLARQHREEDHALQHQHRRIGQAEPALQQAAARVDPAEQDRDRNDRNRIMQGE